MEKELILESPVIDINFFFDEFDLTEAELSEYEMVLDYFCEAIIDVKNETLNLEHEKFVLNINLLGDDSIQALNNEHRGKDKITDVLSFPLQESIRNSEFDEFNNQIELGDLFVCKSVCEKQAEEFKIPYMDEFIHLVVHGFLHVCGFDHELSEAEEKLMETYEKEIIETISFIKKGEE
jgi:rRNA maturation RNase YbeY